MTKSLTPKAIAFPSVADRGDTGKPAHGPTNARSGKRDSKRGSERPNRAASGRARRSRRAASGGALGNTQTALPESSQQRRGRRWEMRRGLKSVSKIKRLKKCGTPMGAAVSVKFDEALGAGYGNLETCGSVWSCPVCAAKIATRRGEELRDLLATAMSQEKTVSLFTLTVRHRRGQPLKSVWDAVQSGWGRITSGRAWQDAKSLYGIIGWVRAVEVTQGSNGWHVHIHAVLVTECTPQQVRAGLGEVVWDRWSAGIEKKGFSAERDKGGFDISVGDGAMIALGAYLTKMQKGGGLFERTADSLAREVVQGQQKSGRLGGRAPFEVLADAVSGDIASVKLWQEWERGSQRRRQLTWSRGLREWASVDEERTDEEIAEESPDSEMVLVLPRASFIKLGVRQTQLLDLVEAVGVAAAKAWLNQLGLDWRLPPDRDSD